MSVKHAVMIDFYVIVAVVRIVAGNCVNVVVIKKRVQIVLEI